ncbi:MAG: carbohydrate binding domain-containing protein [Verrucomicrobiae bacterium]|nr:carbohydrate binding domain-containing protein [Verrucomicrobiae bacterium]
MKHLPLAPLILLTTSIAAAQQNWIPFHLPWETPTNAVADASFLLDPPAGKHGKLEIRKGHFHFQHGPRVRFWGINLSGEGCLPPRDIAPRLADRLAKFGFNLVRFHGLDSTWGRTLFPKDAPDTQHLAPEQLDKLDYLVAQLKQRGIYINLNLHVARRFKPADNLPQTEYLGYAKYCPIFNPRMIELQKDYARKLLTHRNPYTGLTYAEDPAIVIIELTNENSLFGGWTRGFLRGQQTQRNPGTWADIPPYYGQELTRLYNDWLQQRYRTRQKLAAAWSHGARPPGPQLLKNPDFTNGTTDWELTQRNPAAAKLQTTHEAPNNKPCAKITVESIDDTPWHIMLTQRPVKLQQSKQYQVQFRARSTTPRRLPVEVCHSTPYRGYGSARFDLSTEWQTHQFTFTAPQNDDQARLSFQLGNTTGTVWITDIILREAPIYGLHDDEDPTRSTVRRLTPEEFSSHTDARFRDEGRFYYELERRYYLTMYQFLRNELKVRALIEGTNHNYGLPSLRAQALLDLMDCHAYWQHPSFPRQPWSRTDWYITNTPMLDAPHASTIAQLARSAVAGKPFTVSEYNHPFPNEYGCEMPLLIAAYARLQDWDAIYTYTFLHRWTDRELSGNVVTGYFDIANEVSKMIQMPTASILFQRGDIQPAHKTIKVTYDENRTYDSLKEPRTDRIAFHLLGGQLSPLLPLVHQFRVLQFDAQRTTHIQDIAFNDPADEITSDTGQLRWTASGKGTGRLTINTPRTQAAIGWIAGQTLHTADVEFRISAPKFCAVSLAALDNEPLARSQKILLVAAARCANTGMQWNNDRTSIADRWGNPPLLIEPVEGELTLRRHPATAPLTLVPLDPTGCAQPGKKRALPGTVISLRSADATPWYLLTAE